MQPKIIGILLISFCFLQLECTDSRHSENDEEKGTHEKIVVIRQEEISDNCSRDEFSKAYELHHLGEYDTAFIWYLKAADGYMQESEWACAARSFLFAGETQVIHHSGKAEIYLGKAFAVILQHIPERLDLKIHYYNRMGYLYFITGYPNMALGSFHRASALLDSVHMKNPEIPAYIKFSIGDIYRVYYQHPEEAEKYYREAADILTSDTLDHAYYLSKIYYNLGTVCYLTGDFIQSEAFINKTIQYLKTFPPQDRTLMEACHSMLGHLHYEKGNREESIRNLWYAVKDNELYKNSKYELGNTYNYIGDVLIETGDYEKAHSFLIRCMNLCADSTPACSNLMATSYMELGKMHQYKREYSRALIFFKKALEMLMANPGNDPLYVAELFKEIGVIHLEQEKFDEAIRALHQSLHSGSFRQQENLFELPASASMINPYKAAGITALAANATLKKYITSGKKDHPLLDSALALFLLADTLMINSRIEMVDHDSKLSFLEKSRVMYDNALNAVWHLPNDNAVKRNALALHFIERNKSVILLETLEKSNMLNSTRSTAEIDRKERDLRLELSFSRKSLVEEINKPSPDKKRLEICQNQITFLSLKLDSMDNAYHCLHPSLYNFSHAGKIPEIGTVRKKVKRNELIVEYFWGYTDVFAYFISSRNEGFIRLGATDSLEMRVDRYRFLLSSPDSLYLRANEAEQYQDKAYEVYKYLLEPIVQRTKERTNAITIIPDGPISDIPFEALISSESSAEPDFSTFPYLLYKYIVTYNFSLNLWLNSLVIKSKRHTDISLFLFAGGAMDEFPARQTEISATKKLFNTHVFQGRDASPLTFVKYAPGADIIHLSVHGIPLDTIGNEYGLLLRNDTSGIPEFLTPGTITSLRLQASVAVLAACNAGKGRYYYGDGINSIARSFIAAGCGSVIVSPGRITESVVDKIFSGFYTNLNSGRSLSHSLTNAKKGYLEKSDNILSHPTYWANIRFWGNNTNPIVGLNPGPFIGIFLLLMLSVFIIVSKHKR